MEDRTSKDILSKTEIHHIYLAFFKLRQYMSLYDDFDISQELMDKLSRMCKDE